MEILFGKSAVTTTVAVHPKSLMERLSGNITFPATMLHGKAAPKGMLLRILLRQFIHWTAAWRFLLPIR